MIKSWIITSKVTYPSVIQPTINKHNTMQAQPLVEDAVEDQVTVPKKLVIHHVRVNKTNFDPVDPNHKNLVIGAKVDELILKFTCSVTELLRANGVKSELILSRTSKSKRKNMPVATIIAYEDEDKKIQFRCSACHENDQYSKKAGIKEAFKQSDFILPTSWKAGLIIKKMPNFVERAKKYFQGATTDFVPPVEAPEQNEADHLPPPEEGE